MSIPQSALDFLNKLKNHNEREWFNEHKEEYLKEHGSIIEFAEELLQLMNEHDHIETPTGKKSLFRIYRDTRFSKDKTPYKTHWSGSFKRATAQLRGGYYFHIEPGKSFIAGGFWGPNAADLKRIREEIAANDQELRDVLAQPKFKNTFGELKGDQLKTAPKGFEKDHPAIDLLRYKQFVFTKEFSDKEVLSPDFARKVSSAFQEFRPFFDYMSTVLTTDSNGVSVV